MQGSSPYDRDDGFRELLQQGDDAGERIGVRLLPAR